jgi:hypothetical protein
VNVVEQTETTEQVHNPYHNANYDDAIEDRLDAGLHRNEPVHKPQQNSYYDQRNDKLHERHIVFSFRILEADRDP